MSISIMDYYDELQQNRQVQYRQGTESYLQVQEGQTDSQLSDDITQESSYSDVVRKDSIMISEEGRQASVQMSQNSDNSVVQQLQEDSSEETELQAEDLAEYTDAELKQMYYRGEITLQEYEDETGESIE